ncbi:flavin reductase family protein [Candidatus Palauibacter sp.]|uniref:flavin reductase family protein n=1 Tax=Candidatus Palauibacter sp. TaxID=3101350 RepID=UPI003B5B6712
MSVSARDYRGALANLAGGVVIVTTSDWRGQPRGMTATAVCSVSIEPPLVMACVHREAATHRAIGHSRAFALNLLPARSEDLARRFASSRRAKFDGLRTETGETGAPILADAMAHCECKVERAVDAGDHTIYIGRVLEVGYEKGEERPPLLYFRGGYRSIAP